MEKKINLFKSQIRNITFGKNCTIIEPSNLYECELGNDVFVGPFVEIQKDSNIGKNTRISSHTFICEGVDIGEDCFVGHGVMFINDVFSDSKSIKDWKMKKTKIKLYVNIVTKISKLDI